MMTLVFLTIALLALSYVLSRSTDVLISGIGQLADGAPSNAYGITTFFVALATSFPEIFVGVASALNGESELPLGVALGSNIVNVSVVIGGAAVISGVIRAKDHVFKKEILYAFLVGTLPLILLLDKRLGRADGLVLLIVYVVHNVVTLTKRKQRKLKRVEHEYYEDKSFHHRILQLVGRKDIEQGLGKLVVGSILLVVCADLIVRLAVMIADVLSIPTLLVGLFMVSIGTSLPELAFEIKTVAKREYLLAFGNIVGSTVVNSSLMLGLVALLSPIVLDPTQQITYFTSVLAFIITFGAFWGFTYSKKQIERWEGAVLLSLYFVFALIQMMASCALPVQACT